MIIRADARHLPLAAGCVQTVVTSPPYWGLRDYGTAKWGGGDAACDHVAPAKGGIKRSTLNAKRDENGWLDMESGHSHPNLQQYPNLCGKCGAQRIDQQIGLEATPEAYVATMVAVFREVWRVLRDDGTVWLNLGDSYTANGGGGESRMKELGHASNGIHSAAGNGQLSGWTGSKRTGLKSKDLTGIPWRVALALQADGWYLRSDIIWAKPNPMPESVTDRPTRSHEYIFLLSKSERYFYDADAIREPWADDRCGDAGRANTKYTDDLSAGSRRYAYRYSRQDTAPMTSGRNKRDVWTVNSEPTPDAHFATFPQKLIEPCILAGSRSGDLVLDPFLGSGTVGKVCERLGRRWAGTELSEAYIKIAGRRTAQMGLGL